MKLLKIITKMDCLGKRTSRAYYLFNSKAKCLDRGVPLTDPVTKRFATEHRLNLRDSYDGFNGGSYTTYALYFEGGLPLFARTIQRS